ncbi:MAG: WD40 repeat domain-containing protein [Lishizhenia sp.]
MTNVIKTIKGHSGAIYDACLTGNDLYTTSADKYTVRWKINEGVQDKFAVKSDHSAFKISLIKEDSVLVIGSSKGNLHCIDLASKEEIKNLAQHKSSVFSITENKVKNEFYTTDAQGYFCAWCCSTLDLKITLPLACGKIRSCAVNEDGTLISLACQDGKIRILETSFFNEIITFKAHHSGVNTTLFNGDYLVSGGKDAFIRKWKWKSQELLTEVPAHNFAVYDIISMNNGNYVSASFDKTVKVWNSNLEIIERLDKKSGGHSHTVNRLVKINQNEFFSISDDKSVVHWSLV